jgi:hypothetical protein
MTVTATYHGDEIKVTFTAQTEPSDYGVQGAPVFDVIIDTSIEVSELSILGVVLFMNDLAPALQNKIMQLASDCEFTEE